jgi:hypothetical protein
MNFIKKFSEISKPPQETEEKIGKKLVKIKKYQKIHKGFGMWVPIYKNNIINYPFYKKGNGRVIIHQVVI